MDNLTLPGCDSPKTRQREVGFGAGPLLGKSVSPAIGRLRTELSTSLRGAVMATGDLGLLRRWLQLPEGSDDRDGWRLLHDSARTAPMERAVAGGHLAGLDLEFG